MEYIEPSLDHLPKPKDFTCRNEHTLYLTIGDLEEGKVKTVICNLMRKAKEYLLTQGEKEVGMRYNLVIPSNKEGKTFGIAYCWVESVKIYNVLTKFNADGSERFVLEDQHEEKIETKPAILDTWVPLDDPRYSNWAADDDIFDAPPPPEKKKIPLPPLIGRYLVKYSDKELAMAHVRYFNETGRKPDDSEISRDILVHVSPALVYTEIDEGLTHNIICSHKLPKWVTQDMLMDKIKHYAPNTVRLSIKIVPKGDLNSVYVTFNKYSTDAQFALHMIKKVDIVPPKGVRGSPVMLSFYHAPLRQQSYRS